MALAGVACGGEPGLRVENEDGTVVVAQQWRASSPPPSIEVSGGERLHLTFTADNAGPSGDGLSVWVGRAARSAEEVAARFRVPLSVGGDNGDNTYEVTLPDPLPASASFIYGSALFTDPLQVRTFRVRLIR